MWSGGSTGSTSLIWFAITFTVQIVPSGRSLVGSSVIEDPGEPLTEKLSLVAVGHSRVKELPEAVTGSLKLTTMFVFTATWSAASAGEVVATPGAESAVAKEKLEFDAGWSGGSTESTSLIWFAITFTEQIVASGRSLVGSSVIDEPGEPLTVKLSGVPVGHSSVNELPDAVTGSLKFTTMFVFTATCVAASAGEVLVTEGAASDVVKLKM